MNRVISTDLRSYLVNILERTKAKFTDDYERLVNKLKVKKVEGAHKNYFASFFVAYGSVKNKFSHILR